MALVVSRARAHPAPLVAVVVNVLVVCTLVAGVGAILPLVQQGSLTAGLAAEPVDSTVVTAVSTYDADDPTAQDDAVRAVLEPVTAVAGGDLVTRLDSNSYDLLAPGRPTWTFTAFDGADDQLRFVDGRAPEPGTNPLEVAVPAGSDLAAGQTLRFRSRAGEGRVTATVVGTWEPAPDSERWLDELGDDSMLAAAADFPALAGPGSSARWRAVPAVSEVEADDLDELAAAVSTAATTGVERASEELSSSLRAETDLPAVLAERARELVVLRALLLVPAALLLLLGAACLFLIAAGLAVAREEDESLLRSRGAGPGQLVAPTAVESVLLCAASAGVAPLLAAVLISMGDVRAPLTTAAWLASGLAAVVCAVALVLPVAMRALTGDRGQQLGVERQRRRTLTLLLATVMLVVVLGGLAVLELRGFGSIVTGATAASPTVDPMLVASPALLLLALGVCVALLVLPLLFRLVSSTPARGVSFPLGSRFAARAVSRAVPLALVVILASGTLSFAAVQRLSSADAREARADYEVGADIRVAPPADAVRAGTVAERALLADLPGVEAVTPVQREGTYLEDLPADVLLAPLDDARAGDVLPDASAVDDWQQLVDRPWADPAIGVTLPEGSRQLTVDVPGVDLGRVTLVLADETGVPVLETAGSRGGRVQVELSGGARPGLRLIGVRTGSEDPLTSDDRQTQLPAVVRADDEVLTRTGLWWSPGGIDVVVFGEAPAEPGRVPVLLTEELAERTSLRPGDTAEFQAFGVPLQLEVVATTPYLRTVAGNGGGVLLDSGSALPALLAAGFDEQPSEWWLTVADGRADAVAGELEQHPAVADHVVTRSSVAERLDADPSTGGAALGQLLVLTAGGCLVVGSLLLLSVVLLRRRERADQDRTLVTLGAQRRDVLGVLGSEYALTTGAGALAGVALGALVAKVTMASMTLGPDGEPLVPAPELHVPWLALLPLVAMLGVPLLATVLLTRYDAARVLAAPGRGAR